MPCGYLKKKKKTSVVVAASFLCAEAVGADIDVGGLSAANYGNADNMGLFVFLFL